MVFPLSLSPSFQQIDLVEIGYNGGIYWSNFLLYTFARSARAESSDVRIYSLKKLIDSR